MRHKQSILTFCSIICSYGHPFPDKEFGTQVALELGWRIFDRKGMTKALMRDQAALDYNTAMNSTAYVDEVHFHAYVNSEMNNVLLNMICPAYR